MRPAIAWLLRKVPIRLCDIGRISDTVFALHRFERFELVTKQFAQSVRRIDCAIDYDMGDVNALRAEFRV